MKLHDDWKQILRKAWSMRLIILSAVLSGVEVILPMAQPLQVVPAGVFALLSFATTVAAGIARVIAQPKAGL